MQKQRKVEDVVRGFVTEMTEILQSQADEAMRQKLESILGMTTSAQSAPARKSVKASGGTRKYTRKHCPVPGCQNLGAPRYSWICKDHGQEFKKEGASGEAKAEAFIAAAEKPGGIWYVEGREQQVKRGPGRPKKAQPAPAATA